MAWDLRAEREELISRALYPNGNPRFLIAFSDSAALYYRELRIKGVCFLESFMRDRDNTRGREVI
jgi:hypothetical protein